MPDNARARYTRQMILPEWGLGGQARLSGARVLLVGLGGLGSPAALYLAAAGVGRIRVVDADPVDITNLHRQILHSAADVGRRKTDSARETLTALNPATRVETRPRRLTDASAASLLQGVDAALDCSDNFTTRYALNAACVRAGVPLVWGAVMRWWGQLSAVKPRRSACYQCLFPEPPDPALPMSCEDAGIVGPVAGAVGALMAVETIKLFLGQDTLPGRLLLWDAGRMSFRTREARRRADCPVCGAV